MEDIEAAIEWCKQARNRAERSDRINLSDDDKWFEKKRQELVSDQTGGE